MVSLGPPLLQAELPQLSHPILIGKVVRPCKHLHDLLWKLKQSEVILACIRDVGNVSRPTVSFLQTSHVMRATALPKQISWWPQPAAEVSVSL